MYNCPQKRKHCTLVVRIINPEYSLKSLDRHSNAKQQLEAWYDRVRKEEWDSPANLKKLHGRASIVGKSRAVFRVKGNSYRVVVEVNYKRKIVDIRFIGTHTEYDRIKDVREV